MTEFGMMGVDWEERVDFDRLRRERLKKAKDALDKSGADVLFIFSLENVRYLTGFLGTLIHTVHCIGGPSTPRKFLYLTRSWGR